MVWDNNYWAFGWFRQHYINEALRQLSDESHYTKIDVSSLREDSKLIATAIKEEQTTSHLPLSAGLLRVGQPRQSVF